MSLFLPLSTFSRHLLGPFYLTDMGLHETGFFPSFLSALCKRNRFFLPSTFFPLLTSRCSQSRKENFPSLLSFPFFRNKILFPRSTLVPGPAPSFPNGGVGGAPFPFFFPPPHPTSKGKRTSPHPSRNLPCRCSVAVPGPFFVAAKPSESFFFVFFFVVELRSFSLFSVTRRGDH